MTIQEHSRFFCFDATSHFPENATLELNLATKTKKVCVVTVILDVVVGVVIVVGVGVGVVTVTIANVVIVVFPSELSSSSLSSVPVVAVVGNAVLIVARVQWSSPL